ncbi:hypothetical protein EYF80_006275 [Liparis tanakae]|uniref:Uncharacterized protein n=1 Tax=Liparis tanakae TaxID=230148 RepID=A0A4Z2J0F3_9TELE|nr:hypothetical protein EYF80_006275 [Liparis tanakae]
MRRLWFALLRRRKMQRWLEVFRPSLTTKSLTADITIIFITSITTTFFISKATT